ncbi:unnamed protein product [Rhizophagus irregularis]|nr:unnamed protein product [Rhizophagus irregularis]
MLDHNRLLIDKHSKIWILQHFGVHLSIPLLYQASRGRDYQDYLYHFHYIHHEDRKPDLLNYMDVPLMIILMEYEKNLQLPLY